MCERDHPSTALTPASPYNIPLPPAPSHLPHLPPPLMPGGSEVQHCDSLTPPHRPLPSPPPPSPPGSHLP